MKLVDEMLIASYHVKRNYYDSAVVHQPHYFTVIDEKYIFY